MRSAIVSIAVMVSSMCSSFRAGIRENVEPHHSPLCFGLTLREILIKPVDILVKRWQPLWRRDEKPECQIPDLTRRPTRLALSHGSSVLSCLRYHNASVAEGGRNGCHQQRLGNQRS